MTTNETQSTGENTAATHEAPQHARDMQAEERIANLEKLLADALEQSATNAALRNKVVTLQLEVAELRGSVSWRVTAPLRSLDALIQMLRLAGQTIRRQVQRRGGVTSMFAYYASVFKREGLKGMRARLDRLFSGVGFADGPPSDTVYHEWIRLYDAITPEGELTLRSGIDSMQTHPLISIVVPTYNSNEQYLKEMIASVTAQIYPHWELCIADDASTDPAVRTILQQAADSDKRIKVTFRAINGHISEASNSALALATGDYMALLDHDDVLPPHALAMLVRYVNRYPQARMFYSDEDKLTEQGKRTTPYFKSDWNPEMFLSQNFFSHLGVFDMALVREAGGFRKGFEGSQDWDLALRCVEIAGDKSVIHIPHILYHWRMAPGSTAGSGSEKTYAGPASLRAVQEHFERQNIQAVVEEPFANLHVFRIRYALPRGEPKVSIIIPTRDNLALLRQCINSVQERTAYQNYEIAVVDNGSVKAETLNYLDQLRVEPGRRVIRDESPFNFSALNNRAVSEVDCDYVCLLNNDIEVISPDWLNELVSIAARPGNGAVGACLWYPNGALQHGGVIVGLGGIAGHMHHMLTRGQFGYFARAAVTQNLSAVTAACLVVRRSLYLEVGGLDEELAVAFNDVDFCLRLREAGYRNVWTPFAQLYHHESATRGSDMDPDKYQRFLSEIALMETRWAGHFDRDPAYNPNLSLSTKILPFTLSSPPRIGQFD